MSNVKKFESNQYLTFNLDTETFAIEISQVKEVLDYTKITKIPRMPDFLRGVINLRGSVVPVIDLRTSLGMDPIDITVNTCIIIAEIDADGDLVQVGALADSVQEVIEISPKQIGPPPKIGDRVDTAFIKGIAKRGEDFVIILRINDVLSADEIELVENSVELSSEPAEDVQQTQADVP